MAMSKFSKSAAALPPSVLENPPIPFVSKVKKATRLMGLTRTSLSGSSWSFSWIQTTPPEVPSTPDSLLSSRMDAITRELDQVCDGLP
jgi:hypothetical protein